MSADDKDAIFTPVVESETALPARRTVVLTAPKSGGDVLVKVCEGSRDIKVTKPEPKPQKNGTAEGSDEDMSSDEEDEEDIREKVWKAQKALAELAIRGVKQGGKGKIEITVNVGSDLGVNITAREVGGKGGVRGVLEKPHAQENGKA